MTYTATVSPRLQHFRVGDLCLTRVGKLVVHLDHPLLSSATSWGFVYDTSAGAVRLGIPVRLLAR